MKIKSLRRNCINFWLSLNEVANHLISCSHLPIKRFYLQTLRFAVSPEASFAHVWYQDFLINIHSTVSPFKSFPSETRQEAKCSQGQWIPRHCCHGEVSQELHKLCGFAHLLSNRVNCGRQMQSTHALSMIW